MTVSSGIKIGCLYISLVLLAGLVITTSFSVTWILTSLNLGLDGIGLLHLVEEGVKLVGETFVLDTLFAGRISSRLGVPMMLQSDGNFSINIRNDDSSRRPQFLLDPTGVQLRSNEFTVTDPRGRVLFSTNKKWTEVGSRRLVVKGNGGVSLSESLGTRAVRSPAGHPLTLESSTSTMSLLGPSGVSVDSIAGSITLTSLHNVKLRAKGHSSEFKIDAGTIRLPRLPSSQLDVGHSRKHSHHSGYRRAMPTNRTRSRRRQGDHIYQLCVCRNGRLFISPSLSHCVADSHVCRETGT